MCPLIVAQEIADASFVPFGFRGFGAFSRALSGLSAVLANPKYLPTVLRPHRFASDELDLPRGGALPRADSTQ